MPEEDSDEIGWYARYVMENNPGFFGSPETWDPKLRRKAEETEMKKKTLSIDEVGKKGSAYDELPLLSNEEALSELAKQALRRAIISFGETEMNPRLQINDRVAGAVYTTLRLLEKGSESTPAFKLIADLSPDPDLNSYGVPVVHLLPPEKLQQAFDPRIRFDIQNTDYVTHGWPRTPIELAGTTEDSPPITQLFSEVYDKYRDRLSASAKDLFEFAG
jgi:hypothetical protein